MEYWKNGVLKNGVRASSPVLVQAKTPAHQYGEPSFPHIPPFPPTHRSLSEGGYSNIPREL